jgi:hypothetical protein
MAGRFTGFFKSTRTGLVRGARAMPWLVRMLVIRPLAHVLTLILALVLLFEEWGLDPLVRAFGWIAKWRPIAALEAGLARLPPYAALAAFVLPAAVLFPFKLLALYLLAHGQPILAGLVFVAAKVVGTGLVGRIFLITRPQLMQIGWFARVYAVLIPWKDAVFERVRASWAWRWGRVVKTRAKRQVERLFARPAG